MLRRTSSSGARRWPSGESSEGDTRSRSLAPNSSATCASLGPCGSSPPGSPARCRASRAPARPASRRRSRSAAARSPAVRGSGANARNARVFACSSRTDFNAATGSAGAVSQRATGATSPPPSPPRAPLQSAPATNVRPDRAPRRRPPTSPPPQRARQLAQRRGVAARERPEIGERKSRDDAAARRAALAHARTVAIASSTRRRHARDAHFARRRGETRIRQRRAARELRDAHERHAVAAVHARALPRRPCRRSPDRSSRRAAAHPRSASSAPPWPRPSTRDRNERWTSS